MDYDLELAQINAEIEADEFAAVQEDAINYLTDFFAQIGIEDNEQLLAQL